MPIRLLSADVVVVGLARFFVGRPRFTTGLADFLVGLAAPEVSVGLSRIFDLPFSIGRKILLGGLLGE